MKMGIRQLPGLAVSLLLALPLLAMGCGQSTPAITETPPSTPIKVHLSISEAPVVNATARLTLIVSTTRDALNTEAHVKLPAGATPVSGNLTWRGDLKAGQPISLSAEIMFSEAGKWAIEATARSVVDASASWGDIDVVYLTIGTESSSLGWPPTGPVKIEQVTKGEVEGVPSSQEEPPEDTLPRPPAVSENGSLIQPVQ